MIALHRKINDAVSVLAGKGIYYSKDVVYTSKVSALIEETITTKEVELALEAKAMDDRITKIEMCFVKLKQEMME